MSAETTYTALRQNLAAVLDNVTSNQTIVIVRRKNAPDVALLPADELAALTETAHLLRSPKNAQRLLNALRRSDKHTTKPQTSAALRKQVGLGSTV